MQPSDYNYISIDLCVRKAKRLRDEEAARLIAAAWCAAKKFTLKAVTRKRQPGGGVVGDLAAGR